MTDKKKKDEFLVCDVATSPSTLWCKVCDERFEFANMRMTTAIELVKAFRKAHNQMGCTQEKYEKMRMMDEL